MKLKEQEIFINGVEVKELQKNGFSGEFKTEQDIYLTASWFMNNKADGKPFDVENVRVNGLNQYFIKSENGLVEERVYFKDVKKFELNK